MVCRTFEGCYVVHNILHCFHIAIDDCDISLESQFLSELKRVLCEKKQQQLILPQLFIGNATSAVRTRFGTWTRPES
ncbi:hypothetical protein IEQ34_018503 [Dendrobium chrysotoxum]|uniref:Uncharacterized protein n=1 Tax=Dendrobium chrysotoxum TaxID=161865 RepID=A0AAV7G6B7_DENCH|nr:hypothetical protein IEQ34_018503 [Dendrobium chrysotoxum]